MERGRGFGPCVVGPFNLVCIGPYFGSRGHLQWCYWVLTSVDSAGGFGLQTTLADDSCKGG